jgi:hypothetical protein
VKDNNGGWRLWGHDDGGGKCNSLQAAFSAVYIAAVSMVLMPKHNN